LQSDKSNPVQQQQVAPQMLVGIMFVQCSQKTVNTKLFYVVISVQFRYYGTNEKAIPGRAINKNQQSGAITRTSAYLKQ
jgi:hypothetical protein